MTDQDPKTVFVRASLIRTADHNYVLSRHAFLRGMTLDGFWMAAHAVEKYLKAALLLNGKDTRFYAHDLMELWKAYKKVATGFIPEHFVEPRRSTQTPLTEWGTQTLDQFIEYLARFGSPDNRYQLVGYLYDSLVLAKLDQLVFFIRRTCRNLEEKGAALKDSRTWKVWSHLPLELCSEQDSHELRPFFLEANPFWVSIISGQSAATRHNQKVIFQAGSLQMAILAARKQHPENPKPAVIDLLRWLLRHVRLSKANQSKVRRALKRLTSNGRTHDGAALLTKNEEQL